MAGLAESTGLEHLSLQGLGMPLTLRLPVPLNDEELISFSRRNRTYRIERNRNGDLEIMSPVGGHGSHLEAVVVAALFGWAEAFGGISFSSNGGFNLRDGSILSPDAAWITEQSWNALSGDQQRRYPPLCPEFVIEILSETDSSTRLQEKMGTWIANGAQLAWMIDPYSKTVRIYRPECSAEMLEQPNFVEAHVVVPGFRLTTAKLWKP